MTHPTQESRNVGAQLRFASQLPWLLMLKMYPNFRGTPKRNQGSMECIGRYLTCSSHHYVLRLVCQALLISVYFLSHASAQRDPGPRANPSAGSPLSSLGT